MKLDRVTGKPGSAIDLSYVFKDDIGQVLTSEIPVTVSIYTKGGDVLEFELQAELKTGSKYLINYTIPKDRPLESYLVEFKGRALGSDLVGYLQLDVVLATDADFAELSGSTESSVTYDGTSVAFTSSNDRLKALQALKPPSTGFITKKRRRSSVTCDDTRDYVRFKV